MLDDRSVFSSSVFSSSQEKLLAKEFFNNLYLHHFSSLFASFSSERKRRRSQKECNAKVFSKRVGEELRKLYQPSRCLQHLSLFASQHSPINQLTLTVLQ
jgi:hypothetical protein